MREIAKGTLPTWVAYAVFGCALLARLAYWQATPDRDWPHSVSYKGDAIVWSAYSAALERGQAFELGLPLRPPGNGYLLSWIGVAGPEDVARAKLVWCLLGALAVTLFYRAALNAFGPLPALVVALWCAVSKALLVLSTSLNNETPYLVLVGFLLLLAPRAARGGSGVLLLWGGLHGLACLVRVEHLLFVLLVLLGWGWRAVRDPADGPRPAALARRLMPLGAGFALVLLPWHLASWQAIDEFNHRAQPLSAGAEAAQAGIERSLAHLEWTHEAERERRELPAFARRSAANFVAATVAWRGGRQVTAADFDLLEQAFGSRPRPLGAHPFVTLYGPLNFYLAQRVGAPAGFDPRGLDRPPPLAGGAGRYPTPLLGGLPPPELNFNYPPHVEIVNEGYRLGLEAIAAQPTAALRRALARLDIAWQGASLGWTGYGVPWGASGLRRAVDMAVPQGRLFALWRAALAVLCAAALWRARGLPQLWPWAFLALYKLAAAALFFGYARHGATAVPAVALLVGLLVAPALERRFAADRRWLWVVVATAGLALAIEGWRLARPPQLLLDDRAIESGAPFPADDHLDRELSVR